MGLTFKDKELIIGGTEWTYAPFRFSEILKIGSGIMPTWQDVIVSGAGSLTLLNAKENGLNYLKFYGGCEKDFTPISMDYETVYNMQFTTFDSSKFTVVGSPTINNGVVTDFSSSDYVKGNFELGNLLDKSWKIEIRFWYDKDAESATGAHGSIVLFGNSWRSQAGYMGTADFYKLKMWVATKNNDNNSENVWYYIPNKVIAASGYVYESLSFDYSTGTYTMYFEFPDGTTDTKLYTPTTNNKQMYNVVLNPTQTLQFGYGLSDGLAHSPVDLKYINVYVEGVKVFSGNITGTDTYTVNGSTVSIPYTSSSIGDKIVDSIYLTSVQSVIENLETSTYIIINNSNETATDYRARILCNNGILKVNNQGEIYADGTVETVKDSLNNTATIENLFAIGTVKDVQDVLTGTVTRNCEAIYYDGTQTINTPYISTTGGLDVGAIIVHPKTIPTTETVTAQTLTVQTGSNTIEITQASIEDLPLEVSYKAGVTVTIEEIENANIDNSVEVTIS